MHIRFNNFSKESDVLVGDRYLIYTGELTSDDPKTHKEIYRRLYSTGFLDEAAAFKMRHLDMFNDEIARLCRECGVDLTKNIISSGGHLIDGLPIFTWRALYTDEITDMSIKTYYTVVSVLSRRKRYDLIYKFQEKYRHVTDKHNKKLLRKHKIMTDVDDANMDFYTINGISYAEWRLLNDDTYYPRKGYLVFKMQQYADSNKQDELERVKTKYSDLLEVKHFDPKVSLEEAMDILANLLNCSSHKNEYMSMCMDAIDGKEQNNDTDT